MPGSSVLRLQPSDNRPDRGQLESVLATSKSIAWAAALVPAKCIAMVSLDRVAAPSS
jgi:hypothetical protein